MDDEQRGAAMLAEIRKKMGPELIELLLEVAGQLPTEGREWTTERAFEYLRCRLKFTQAELAQKAGLAQSQVSRVEGGSDALLSTWRRIYAAMGFELVLLPSSRLTLEELEKRAEEGRPPRHWMRQRARPRRRWMKRRDQPAG